MKFVTQYKVNTNQYQQVRVTELYKCCYHNSSSINDTYIHCQFKFKGNFYLLLSLYYVWIQTGENGQPSYYNVPNSGTDTVMPGEYAVIGSHSTGQPQVIKALEFLLVQKYVLIMKTDYSFTNVC